MNRTRKLTYNGLTAALVVVILYVGALTKSKLSFLAIASFALSIPVLVSGLNGGILTIITVDILSFLLIPNLNYVLAFLPVSFYPIVKSIAERKKGLEWVIKYGHFNLSLIVIFIFARVILTENILLKNNLILFAAIAFLEVVFYFYDYIFTKIVYYVDKRLGIVWIKR